MTRRGIPTAILGLLFIAASADCTLIASSELKTGIGQPCAADDECQGGVCTTLKSGNKICSTDCTVNEDCPAPSICIEKLCKIGCENDTGCGAGNICLENVCQAGCRGDTDCPSQNVCGADLKCTPGCRGDTDCGSGQICNASSKKCEDGCRKDDTECGGIEAGKICEANKCSAGCRDDSWCKTAGTICEALTCVTGCRTDEVCGKGNICLNKVCAPGCKDSAGCPDGNYCDTATVATGECKTQLAVAALLPDDPAVPMEDGWTASHVLGLEASTKAAYVNFGAERYHVVGKVRTTADADKAIDAQIAAGAKVIITTTATTNAQARTKAEQYPNVDFVMVGARKNGGFKNLGAYFPQSDKLWYATGKLAARNAQSGTKCIGLVLPTPTKQIVRDTNAFTRGVLSFNPDIKVVIRWVGGTQDVPSDGQPGYDYTASHYSWSTSSYGKVYREELLAAQLADLGCTVIGHRTETQRVVSFVDEIDSFVNAVKPVGNKNLLSLGSDVKDACKTEAKSSGAPIATCFGAPYWAWGPIFGDVLSKIYANNWDGAEVPLIFQTGPSAVMKFETGPSGVIQPGDADLVMNSVANEQDNVVFKGPYNFNGQRDVNADGYADTSQAAPVTGLGEDELQRMCWFVNGVYELPDYKVVDIATVKPAMVPWGPEVPGETVVINSTQASMAKYGDVLEFASKYTGNIEQLMSCPQN